MSDLKAYATREAAALWMEYASAHRATFSPVDLLALAWLQGVIYAGHETLADAEIAYQKVRAEL